MSIRIPRGEPRLTGEVRFRSGWFGGLVLQVEYVNPELGPDLGERHWRDARTQDLAIVKIHGFQLHRHQQEKPPNTLQAAMRAADDERGY